MADAAHSSDLIHQAVVFLGAAAIAVPAFRFAGLSGILGYLVAGIAIGPSGFAYFTDPGTLFTIAEVGVVMFLFVIGLELKVSQLIAMRRDIAWLGGLQMIPTALVLTAALIAFGMVWNAALTVGIALALSATSIALQILQERGHMQHVYGKKTFSILLFQDLSVVPILAIVPLLAVGSAAPKDTMETVLAIAKAVAAIGAIILAGRYLLNPMFRFLARLNSHEIMTIAALLVVLGAAVLMSFVGMSMALGAFLAGMLLAESNFRHELEADIEPFRGLLLGLFFMSVGMLIDLGFVRQNFVLVIAATVGLISVKFIICALIGIIEKAPATSYLRASSVLTPAGEFSFVILPVAGTLGILTGNHQKLFMAVAAFSMLLGPLVSKAVDVYVQYLERTKNLAGPRIDEDFDGANGKALVIGFGRFGQIVNQMLLTSGTDVTVIDNDIEMIEAAGGFGFKVYYGDGQRLDVLRAAGAEKAEIICLCVDNQDAAVTMVEIIKHNFPQARLLVRAYDRRHAITLMRLEPDVVMREVFESALSFGGAALKALGRTREEAEAMLEDVRKRDLARLQLQLEGDIKSGSHLNHKEAVRQSVKPAPLIQPAQKSTALSPETQEVFDQAAKAAGKAN
ncbi:MAG: monovalent cation:proton antiporter-2 (CPA2) family protein [Beijerinckiaceae bacterium]